MKSGTFKDHFTKQIFLYCYLNKIYLGGKGKLQFHHLSIANEKKPFSLTKSFQKKKRKVEAIEISMQIHHLPRY